MKLLVAVLIVWVVVSIPLAPLVGQMLARSHPRPPHASRKKSHDA